MIDLEKTIRKLMIDENVNLTELGRRINNSTSNLSNKLRLLRIVYNIKINER